MENILFQTMKITRERTLELVAGTDPKLLTIVPKGFNNNMHWHIGHILSTQEKLSFYFIGEPFDLEESLMGFFGNGTKPEAWTSPAPEVPLLIELLQAQPARITRRLSGQMDRPLTSPFKDFKTLAEILAYSLTHESLHMGYMMALRRAAALQ